MDWANLKEEHSFDMPGGEGAACAIALVGCTLLHVRGVDTEHLGCLWLIPAAHWGGFTHLYEAKASLEEGFMAIPIILCV